MGLATYPGQSVPSEYCATLCITSNIPPCSSFGTTSRRVRRVAEVTRFLFAPVLSLTWLRSISFRQSMESGRPMGGPQTLRPPPQGEANDGTGLALGWL